MLLPIKTICATSKVRKDGTSLVFIQYCKSEKDKTLLNTEIAIPPKYWHKKLRRITNDLPSEYGEADVLNNEIYRLYRVAEDIIKFALTNNMADPVGFAKKTFKPDFDICLLKTVNVQKENEKTSPKVNLDFFFQMDAYIKAKARTVTDETTSVFKQMRKHLQAFEEFSGSKITFDSLDYDFYEQLIDYLTFDYVQYRRTSVFTGLKLNTIGKTIKQLRIFIRDRVRRKIIPAIDLSDFKVPEEKADAIYLSVEEIKQIYFLDLCEHPHLQKYRDLFVFGCMTGLRFSDFSTLKANDVRDKKLYKKQEKSDHWVVIPLRDEAYRIFTTKFNRTVPIVSNPEFNTYIKEIGKLAGIADLITFSYKKGKKDVVITKPKYEWITSHSCRRSFCTNEFLAGTPVRLIMQISGHKNERDFFKYIKIGPEEAALQIEKIWNERNIELPHNVKVA